MQDKVILDGHTGWVRALAAEGRWLFRYFSFLRPALRQFGAIRTDLHSVMILMIHGMSLSQGL